MNIVSVVIYPTGNAIIFAKYVIFPNVCSAALTYV